jgi:hypothetical protein
VQRKNNFVSWVVPVRAEIEKREEYGKHTLQKRKGIPYEVGPEGG